MHGEAKETARHILLDCKDAFLFNFHCPCRGRKDTALNEVSQGYVKAWDLAAFEMCDGGYKLS